MAKLDGTTLTLGAVGLLAAVGAVRRRGSAAMSREDLTNHLAALLETLDESREGWMPASHAYIAFGMDIGKYHYVTNFARKAGWLKKTAEVITITPQGREMAERVRDLSRGKGSRAGSQERVWSVILNRGASEELAVEIAADTGEQAAERALERHRKGEFDEGEIFWDCESSGEGPGNAARVVDVTALSRQLSPWWDE